MLETLRRRWFSLIHLKNLVYNQCWEDPRLDRVALELTPSDRVVIITSAGCNALDYALAWLEANATLRQGPGDWSRGPRNHSFEAEQEYWTKMKAWQRRRFDGGWAAITWAREHGGRGGTPAQAILFAQEQSAFDVTSGFIDAAVGLIGPALIKYGTPAQRER